MRSVLEVVRLAREVVRRHEAVRHAVDVDDSHLEGAVRAALADLDVSIHDLAEALK